MPDGNPRLLLLRLEGPLLERSRVPVSLLCEKLQALQRVLFGIGTALRGGGHRGRLRAEVAQACELQFVESRPGSLEVAAELPTSGALPYPLGDLGLESLDHFDKTLLALGSENSPALAALYPDHAHRARVLNSITPILPEEDGDYDIILTRGSARFPLRKEWREFIGRATREDSRLPEEAVRTLTGTLFRIEVATGERQLGLLVRNRKIPCFYSLEYEPLIQDLIPGSLVEVEGRVTLGEQGDVQRVEELFDVRAIQLLPLRWGRVDSGNQRFRLRIPIQIAQDFQDGVWVHENEPLGILAYGHSRADSLEAFRSEFAAIWDGIAEEEDSCLTVDARQLKAKLREIVERVEDLA
jgi:hypothetical protein